MSKDEAVIKAMENLIEALRAEIQAHKNLATVQKKAIADLKAELAYQNDRGIHK